MYTFQVSEVENKYKILTVLDPNIALWVNLGESISTDNADLFDFMYDKLEEGYSLYVSKDKDLSALKIGDIEVVKEEDIKQKINMLKLQAIEKLGQILNVRATEYATRYIAILIHLIRKDFDETQLIEKDKIKLAKVQKLFEAYDKYLEFNDKMLSATTLEGLDSLYQSFIGELNEIQQSPLLQD
jgi:uncharacterized protein YsxB (DUF464 family)